MSDWRNQLTDANSPKEKCQILQTMLSQMTVESVDEYSTLESATKGVYGPEIKAYSQKCLQFADKKFPTMQTAVKEAEKAKLDALIKSKADMPETKNCPYCLQLIPFAAIKCHHCGSEMQVTEVRKIENTYPVSAVEIMTQANHKGSSDIHLQVGYHPIFRIHGHMTHQIQWPKLKPSDTLSMAYQMLDEDSKRIFEAEKETDMAFDIPGTCRLRVNAAEERLGCTVVARILPSNILSMDDLKFRAKDVFKRMCLEVNGLILVTGPTGSGKTTTLAAMLDYINSQRNEHMITIEDPIEFVHTPKKSKIMQRELRTNTLTFYNALRSALRQDPDIILVGELRDQETTALALEAAETGHLVFGTLHTNSAAKTIDRIINMFSSEDQAKVRVNLAENLKGIIAQQLVKKVGGGRVVVQEIMLRNTAIAALIRDGKTYQINEYIQTAKNMGMQTMDEAIKHALEQGEISQENAYRYALNKADFTYTKELEAFEKN